MGLFDMFGAGGGSLTVVPQANQVSAGQRIRGTVTFTGGKRSQKVTTIKVRFVQEERRAAPPGQPTPPPETRDVVAPVTVSGAFETSPATPHAFSFDLELPPKLAAEQKGVRDYKLTASVDIPGEPDAHATADVQVLDAAPVSAGIGMPLGMGMGMPMGAPMLGVGAAVLAQHPMGGLHPGRIVAEQPGLFGIDWDDARLGASTWIATHLVQAPSMGLPPLPSMSLPLSIGAPVQAQHPMGGWHKGRVVAMQDGLIGVDWLDPQLGSSAWLQPGQVQPGN